MTRKELVEAIEPMSGLPKSSIDDVLNLAMQNIIKSLEKGEPVYLRGFGTFSAKERKSKKAQIIGKGETITLPETTVPHFKPAKSFKNSVAKNK